MPAETDDLKSPKMPRKGKEACIPAQATKQVHWDADDATGGKQQQQTPLPNGAGAAAPGPSSKTAPASKDASAAKAQEQPSVDNQPTSFPQVGPPPGHFGPGQWYTSADPRRSLNQQQHHQQQHHHHHLHQQQPFAYYQQTNGGWPGIASTGGAVPGQLFANGASPGAHFYAAAPAPPFHFPACSNSNNNFCLPQPAYSAVSVGQPGYVVSQQPAMIPQLMTPGQQPVYVAGQVSALPPGVVQAASGQVMGGGVMPAPGGSIPVVAGNSGNPPDVSGLGRTQGEESVRQLQFAHANKLFEPQEFKPADDDPSRFYYVREVDGNWTQRNRFTIDHMGDCRWYVTDEGWFYAVRLPD